MKKTTFSILVILFTFFQLQGQIKDAESLIKAMHAKYSGNFNANITFIQLNQDIDETGKVTHSMSYEAFHYPGKFRNDMGPSTMKEGYIVADDKITTFKDGKKVQEKPCVMDVGLLTGDIYFMAVEEAIKECKKHGYDLTKFREDVLKGKSVYVVGTTDKADEKSPQFWIDKQELYVVRDINFSEEDGQLEDIHYLEHAKVGKAWVEERVEIYANGKLVKKEHYAEVKADNKFDPKMFDPQYFSTIHWRNK
jgi:outer membrane lipoprotein-sorting protein